MKNKTNTKNNEIEKKITDHNHDKYITTPEFSKLTSEDFVARLRQANLVNKADFADKLKHLNKTITPKKGNYLNWKFSTSLYKK